MIVDKSLVNNVAVMDYNFKSKGFMYLYYKSSVMDTYLLGNDEMESYLKALAMNYFSPDYLVDVKTIFIS